MKSSACDFIKKKLWHICVPVSFAKFFFFTRTPSDNCFGFFIWEIPKRILRIIVLKPVLIVTETAAWRCSLKEVFLDFHKNHSKTLEMVSFCLVKLQDLACPATLLITCTSLVFSAKFSEYFRDSYSIKHLWKVASTARTLLLQNKWRCNTC